MDVIEADHTIEYFILGYWDVIITVSMAVKLIIICGTVFFIGTHFPSTCSLMYL